jgi:hypothetical protein
VRVHSLALACGCPRYTAFHCACNWCVMSPETDKAWLVMEKVTFGLIERARKFISCGGAGKERMHNHTIATACLKKSDHFRGLAPTVFFIEPCLITCSCSIQMSLSIF